MKHAASVLTVMLLLIGSYSFSQVGIGVPIPHASAILELSTTNKGFLLPRMSTLQRNGIAGPATGLMVYDTDLSGLVYYNGAAWQLASGGSGSGPWAISTGDNIINTNTGRVGIGVGSPLARFALDSGMVVDQSNSNDQNISGRNVGLFFGNPALAGITSSKADGSLVRSGLSFWTNGVRRMAIDSLGRVAISGLPDPNFSFSVGSGNAFVSGGLNTGSLLIRGDAVIDDRLAVNSPGIGSAALRIKGRNNTPDNWGQHLILVATNAPDSAGILFDTDGVKMRTFSPNDAFSFRNSANEITLSVNSAGDVVAKGEITSLNRGVVIGSDANTHQIRYITSNYSPAVFLGLSGGVSVPLDLSIGSGYTAPPFVLGAELICTTVSSGSLRRILINPVTTTTSSLSFELINTGNTTVNASGCQIKVAVIGPR